MSVFLEILLMARLVARLFVFMYGPLCISMLVSLWRDLFYADDTLQNGMYNERDNPTKEWFAWRGILLSGWMKKDV